jgi:hypothetical protein
MAIPDRGRIELKLGWENLRERTKVSRQQGIEPPVLVAQQ